MKNETKFDAAYILAVIAIVVVILAFIAMIATGIYLAVKNWG